MAIEPTTVVFPFRFRTPFQVVALPLGVRPGRAQVELGEGEFVVRFGPWLVRTPLDNVASAHATGPYRTAKVIGPPRLSLADRGVTFATTDAAGVCVHFARPVAGSDPLGLLRHPAVTVTVADVAGLVETLDR